MVFNISILGASHVKDNKPCQDYSVAWQSEEDGAVVLIVCDGHGSDTYVRSDVGSRLAGEIALEAVKRFILPVGDVRPDSDWIAGVQGAVTARESDVLTRYSEALPRAEEDMTDTDWMRYRQRLEFRGQVKGIYEQDAIFQALFSSIYEKWLEAIHQDARQNPFTEEELSRLGKHKLVKAYGTTLMTYVQARDFWFAFHIGDGRMLSLGENQEWKQIVPWDCNCFQNQTTSLCNTDPVPMFRYAFDGTGAFPKAVFCCSDGIEDSYGDYDIAPERLHNYFSGLLNVFVQEGKESTMSKLEEFLPKLSAVASKDDMSIAGVINEGDYHQNIDEDEIT
jgi:hypothetical protein